MEIVASLLDWVANDEENWAKFLATETGKRLIPKLMERCPILLADGTINAVLIRSGEVRGFQAVAQAMFDLTQHTPERPAPADNYPAPENDKAWQDGQKLENAKPKNVLEPDFSS